jgi:hypothetical protein
MSGAGFFYYGCRERLLKRIVLVWLLLWGFAGWAGCAKGPGPAERRVTCYCFLNERPCESSRRLEEWTKEALETFFSPDFQEGHLVFRSVDY